MVCGALYNLVRFQAGMTLQAHVAAVAADDTQPRRRHREADAGRVPRLRGDAVGRGDTRKNAAAQRLPVPWCACRMRMQHVAVT